VFVGTCGEKGQIFRIDGPGAKPVEVFSADAVQYIWSMALLADGTIYAATGPNGQLFEIRPDGSNRVLFDSNESNLLCLLTDAKDALYVGTDPNGLVYRVDRKTGASFVIYDARETEISALALDAQGNLYAATAQASESLEPVADSGSGDHGGRPESDAKLLPIPTEPPATPQPPELPLPGPGEPPPIPKDHADKPAPPRSMMLRVLAEPGDPPGLPRPSPAPTRPSERRMPGESIEPTAVGAATDAPAPGGNAIYRIDPDGFVTEVFRENVLVFSLLQNDGVILAGTGNDGRVYQINPSADETVVLAKVDSKDVMCLLPTKSGRIVMGMANSGEIASMSPGYAETGTYTSPVLDATQTSRFGKVQLHGSLPAGSKLTVATR
ncbi:MAG: hypothetical protein ACREJC_17850, partial [Tepidisphaeraceae bacterium]